MLLSTTRMTHNLQLDGLAFQLDRPNLEIDLGDKQKISN